ncbi:RNA 2'-phosphotransferase [Micromonospora sp. NPDC050397]|uniref:RNA 2'-phosphotransferase n=1 Tax=Micromonospora sp. NPDC050397 TaxID=3364279 RepID=UPI00384BEE6C
MEPAELRSVSKRLSRVLRHAPGSVGLTLDANGWVSVDDLLAALGRHGRRVSRAELDEVVAGNDKQRFAVRGGPDGVDLIRASQGHSARVAVDLALDPVAPPELLYHGTDTIHVPAILEQGLRPGRRHHVHLSMDVSTAVTVGRRRGGAVSVLEVEAAKLAARGHEFYRSDNGVWLTATVPPDVIRPPSRRPR